MQRYEGWGSQTHSLAKQMALKTKLMMLQNDKLLCVIDLRDPQRIVQMKNVKARMLIVTMLAGRYEGASGKERLGD